MTQLIRKIGFLIYALLLSIATKTESENYFLKIASDKGAIVAYPDGSFDTCLKVDGNSDLSSFSHISIFPVNMIFSDGSEHSYRKRLEKPRDSGYAEM